MTTATLTGQYVDPKAGKITLEAFYQDWAKRQIWEHSTKLTMDRAMKACTFKTVELGKIRRSHVESWVKSMTAVPLAPITIRARVNNIRTVIRAAIRDKYMAVDPVDGVPLPRIRRSEHAMTIPTPEEVGAVMGAMPKYLRAFVAVCAFAGLRSGEAAAIRFEDFDFLGRKLHVVRQAQRGEGKGLEIRAPKYGSERTVYVPDDLLTIVNEHVTQVGISSKHHYLFFVGQDPIGPNTVHAEWTAARESVGLPKLRVHDLRHFFASGLIAAGVDVVAVQRALGHAKASTTLNTYSHLWPSAEDRTRAAAAGIIQQVRANPADSLRTASPETA
ncbi:site-specific integrase [Leucobacter allii]|uniref:Site-specific integrase n=1 Tax=Leucobacter allii TaxID=2932247 RepID=A0ABY4FIX0_9MICO|nr:site-specific integrase [Leucobacter allii]UOQ56041.1 site-specific integrase [Leucobacter allii]